MAAANGPHVLRSINRGVVLDALRETPGGRTVTEIAEPTGLSRPAVTRALADLENAGLVARDERAEERGVGRPAQSYRFRAELGFIAGVDISPRRVHVVLTDLLGRPVHRATHSTAPSGPAVVRAAGRAIAQGAAAAGLAVEDLWVISVGTTGIVDEDAGVVRAAPSITRWAGLPVTEVLADEYHCPVLLENDANLAALAEGSLGAARDTSTYAYVNWADRVGAGLVLDGRLYRGASSSAGELGFIDPFRDLDRAPTGPRSAAMVGGGRFESLVGLDAFLELAFAMTEEADAADLRAALTEAGPDAALGVLCARASSGDPHAAAVRERVLERFVAGLSTFLLVADPALVVLGGPVPEADPKLAEDLTRLLEPVLFSVPEVRLSELGTEAVALGAVQRALALVEQRLAEQGADGRP